MTSYLRLIARPLALASIVLASGAGRVETAPQGEQAPADRQAPRFRVDPAWPHIPNNWQFGQVASVSVDAQDHVWILQRPSTLEPQEKSRAAPPVLEFDAAGQFIRGWGGPGQGYQWPESEHGIYVDHKGFVWVGGNGAASLRRAAELGDGWHPINLRPAELADGVRRYRAACERFDRAPGPVCLRHMPGGRTSPDGSTWPLSGSPDECAADIRAYAEAGLDELMLSIPARNLDELLRRLRAFMREVAPRV